ncbi:tetratricopeptide repeat protein [Aquabacterium sp.]|uniref:tetratricopeptide repeat protein n=1 Tax=Aquabacterium sp. TaxID=1872578 RepID=UPI002488777A|nr:tetratricopeptide repeat protein [Aquabacterium sp.]MDI1348720.1 tetratricopeptide repeat protein [Aquabacterium sp.]
MNVLRRPPAGGAVTATPRIDWRAAVAQAMALHRAGRLDEAEAMYRQLLQVLPLDANLAHFHGVLLYQRHRTEEAMAQVRRSIALDPNVAAWHNNLGNMLLDQRQTADAAQAYQRCLALDPDNLEVRNNLACLWRLTGHLAEAEALLREAIARAPSYCEAHANLAVVLAQQGRMDEALDSGAHALALKPDNPRSRRMLGALYAQRGRLAEAEQVFRAWLAECPDDPQAQHHLAAVTGQGVPERASDAYVADVFDHFASSFDARLAQLGYQAPALCAQALRRRLGEPDAADEAAPLRPLGKVLDAGCGTGLCGDWLRPRAQQLVGVDLSAAMLARARERGLYDRLEQGELGAWLQACTERFDLIVSADTLCYFGPLGPVLRAARQATAPGGWLVFTVEALAEPHAQGVQLMHHGRYAHHRDAVAAWLAEAGWQAAELAPVVLRQEAGQPVQGWLVSAQAAAG